jgi:hypothetical protein
MVTVDVHPKLLKDSSNSRPRINFDIMDEKGPPIARLIMCEGTRELLGKMLV